MVETRGSRRRSRSDLSLETTPTKESSSGPRTESPHRDKSSASPKQGAVEEKEPIRVSNKVEKMRQDESVKVAKKDAAKSTQEQSAQSSSTSEQASKATNDKKVHINPKKRKKSQTKTKMASQMNELTHFLPGYTAPMKLESSSWDAHRGKRASTSRASAAFQLVPKPTKLAAPSYTQGNTTVASFKTGKRPPPPFKDAGAGWFHMRATPMTEQVAEDLKLIRNRNYLDPKRFYKSTDTFHNTVQAGTVIEGATEYYSSRLTKKQRKETLVQEVMADSAVASYAQDKYRKMQQEKTAASLKRRKQQFKMKGNKYGKGRR